MVLGKVQPIADMYVPFLPFLLPSDSTNPTWDWIQDLAYDIPNWAKEQAVIAAETAHALFGVSHRHHPLLGCNRKCFLG